jgi:hypothetical protein
MLLYRKAHAVRMNLLALPNANTSSFRYATLTTLYSWSAATGFCKCGNVDIQHPEVQNVYNSLTSFAIAFAALPVSPSRGVSWIKPLDLLVALARPWLSSSPIPLILIVPATQNKGGCPLCFSMASSAAFLVALSLCGFSWAQHFQSNCSWQRAIYRDSYLGMYCHNDNWKHFDYEWTWWVNPVASS